ncbi:hypothetical protein [Halomicronema sp. CCY15110]|uniref:hypothetical protein n=1 Tax=Halomicronema sp. CCY15110 TaxID=2767773 RepID=UPI0019501A9A|nr:hypothetical protein [Halomicronema sp. CCY15110]
MKFDAALGRGGGRLYRAERVSASPCQSRLLVALVQMWQGAIAGVSEPGRAGGCPIATGLRARSPQTQQ